MSDSPNQRPTSDSVFKSLLERRVPQILGLYVAATWMAIEIGEWLVERFDLSASLTSYVFVAMATMLPAVAVVAWFHGAPGKDRWTPVEKAVIPINTALALLAVLYVGGAGQPVAATEIRTIVDETGATQTFEVPLAGFHKNLSVFFIANDSADADLDWLSYGLPLLIAHDLNHETPLVTATTPFGSGFFKEELNIRGFDRARGEPRALQLSVARDQQSDTMLSGRIVTTNGAARIQMSLIDVAGGQEIAAFDEPVADWLAAADRISLAVQNELEIDPRSAVENDPLTDNLSDSPEAIRYFVEGQIAVELDNDYPRAITVLGQATQLDKTFAAAFGLLANLHYLSANAQDAIATVPQALAHDYKLSLASKFLIKSRGYIYQGDFEQAIKVLEMWTAVEPQNPESFRFLGRVLLLSGERHDEAIAAFRQALALNPSAHGLYSVMAAVEQSRGDFPAAAQFVRKYLDARPDDAASHLQLAQIFVAAGDFDGARSAYQDAEILATDKLGAAIGLAQLDIRTGDFDAARERLNEVLAPTLTPQQRVQVLNVVAEMQLIEGRLAAMLATLAEMDSLAAQFLPPVARIIQIGINVANVQSLLGQDDAARKSVREMRAQLQPPFDGYMALAKLGVEWEAGDEAAAIGALEEAERTVAQTSLPTVELLVALGRAYRHAYEDDVTATVRQVREAVRLLDSSFVNTINTSVIVLQPKVDMAELLIRVGAIDEAEQLLDAVLSDAPFLGTAHLAMARVQMHLEDRPRAEREVEHALSVWSEADPGYIRLVEARALLARD